MLIVFDFDYTLFDTKKFRYSISEAFGFSEKYFLETYENYFLYPEKINYNFYKHVSFLIADHLIDRKEGERVKKNIIELLKRVDDFVFPEVENILKKLKESNNELVLLTYGDIVWQKIKLKNLGIKKYFNRVFITDKPKITSLDNYKKQKGRKIIINDNINENLKLKNKFPDWEIYLVNGPHANSVEHNFKKYTLEEILQHLIINI